MPHMPWVILQLLLLLLLLAAAAIAAVLQLLLQSADGCVPLRSCCAALL